MIEYVEVQIKAKQESIEAFERFLKEDKRQLALWQRRKWWLEHLEVAYFTARTTWETERFSRDSYLQMYIEAIIGVDGSDIDFHSEPLYFYEFPELEEDVLDDDEQFIKYENPYATI